MGFFKKALELLGEKDDFGVRSSIVRQADTFLNTHSLGDLLPYVTFDETSDLFENRSSVGFVLETLPLVGANSEIQGQLIGLFQHTLPLGSCLQVLFIGSPKVDGWLQGWSQARQGMGDIYVKLAENRTNFLKQLVYDGKPGSPYRLRTFRVIISYSQPRGEFDHASKTKLQELKEQIKGTLEGFALPVYAWTAPDLLRFLDDLLNLNQEYTPSTIDWNPYQDLASQVIRPSTHMIIEPNQLLQEEGQFAYRTYDVRRYPSNWYLGGMGTLMGDLMNNNQQIPCPFLLHYGVRVCDERFLQTKVLNKCKQVEKQANSPFGKWFPSIYKEAEEWRFVRAQFEEGQRLVRTRFQVVLFGKTSSLNQAEQKLIDLYRANKWELGSNKYVVLPSLLSCLPMTWGEGASFDSDKLRKTKMTLSYEPSNLLPLQGEWQGTKTPGLLLAGRRGQLFWWSPFDNTEGNYNCCVVGKSGSGKSVFMQEMMTSILGLGGQVFVLDVGRSFFKTSELLGGTFIEFSTKSPVCLNPFSTIPVGDSQETDEALGMLKCVVALMAAPKVGTNDLEDALIERAVREAWTTKQNQTTISDIAAILLKNKDLTSQNLGNMLFPYTKNGTHGRFFEGETNVNLNTPLVVFEFEELKEQKDLQSVILQMLIIQITNKVYMGDRKKQTALFLDEAWDLLRGKQSGEFIETAARRFRKYNGALVTGTQNVNDFFKSEASQAAFDNSDWMCLLNQKKESIAQLKQTKRLALDEAGLEQLLRSVHTRQGEYAEIAIQGPSGVAVSRLLLDPFSRILYSTKAEEYAAVTQLVSKGMTISEAVETVAAGRMG